MRRTLLLVALGCAGAALFSGGAAANHSGPEDVAIGRGETTATTTAAEFPVEIPGVTFPGINCADFPGFAVCIQTTTTASNTFDFDAKLSSQEVFSGGEPHGHMKLASTTETTTQTFNFGTPTGTAATVTQSFVATAEVTCLRVVNNRAVLSGQVTRYSGDGLPQRGMLFNATDNTIAGIQLAPDEWAGSLQPEALQFCPTPGVDAPITKGSILIEDN